MMPQGYGRGGPWWAKADFDDGQQQQVVLTLCDSAWHGSLTWWLGCKAVLGCCDDDMLCKALGWLVLA